LAWFRPPPAGKAERKLGLAFAFCFSLERQNSETSKTCCLILHFKTRNLKGSSMSPSNIIDCIQAVASDLPPDRGINKRRGERAELRYAVAAMDRELSVAKPYGDCDRFDYVVISRRQKRKKTRNKTRRLRIKISLVQVRSTYFPKSHRTGLYRIRIACGASRRAPYRDGDFHILAAYVAPCDVWYIIPFRFVADRRQIYLSPNNPNRHSGFERFRERWDLLE
jgi:hypothetical protein